MQTSDYIALSGFVAAVLGSYLAYKKAVKASEAASRSETLKVEAGAYERARKLYEDGIKQLEDQVARLRREVTDERGVSDSLRKKINELEETVARLRQQLIKAGVELPPHIQEELTKGESV